MIIDGGQSGPVFRGDFSSVPGRGISYPVQFFNLYYFKDPNSAEEVFKWSKWLYDNVGLVKQAIRKMAIYPITNLVVDGENKDFWYDFLNDEIKVRSVCQKIGLNYFLYGNAIMTIHFPMRKQFICPKCGHATHKTDNIEFKGFKFKGKCESCGRHVEYKVQDKHIKKIDEIKIKIWYPGSIIIDENPLTEQKRFFYKIPKYISNMIKKGENVWSIAQFPQAYIEACKTSKPLVELSPNYTYHMRLPEPEFEESKATSTAQYQRYPFSMPLISGAWRDIFLALSLKKAQESMAADRLVSYRILFPGVQTENPLENLNLATFKNNVVQMLKSFYKDPNRIGVAPTPINQLHIGGDMRPYNPAPEIDTQARQILASIGVPYEFVYGGLQYSGASVSIRMLENLMLNYREDMEAFLRFFVKKVAAYLNKETPRDVRFTDFKMADDIQRKQIMFNLNSVGKVSDSTALRELDLNYENEVQNIKEDLEMQAEVMKKRAEMQAMAQTEAQKIQTMGMAVANARAAEEQKYVNPPVSPGAYARKLMELDDISRQGVLQQLQSSDPWMFNEVIKFIQGQQNISGVDMTPLPEQKPPTRNPDKGVI